MLTLDAIKGIDTEGAVTESGDRRDVPALFPALLSRIVVAPPSPVEPYNFFLDNPQLQEES